MNGTMAEFNYTEIHFSGALGKGDHNSSLVEEPGFSFIPANGYGDSSIMSALPPGIVFAFVILSILCIIWIIFGNVMIIFAYHRFPALHLVSNYLLYQLAIADLLAGFGGIYGLFYQLLPLELIQNFTCCALGQAFMGIPSYVSLLLLLAVTIDRFIAINHPLQYRMLVTLKKVQVLILTVWAGVGLLTIVSIVDWYFHLRRQGKQHCYEGSIYDIEIESRIMGFLYAPLFIIVLIGTLCMYTQIFYIARQQMANQNSKINSAESGSTSLKMNLKIVKTACIIIGLFFICWCPFVIIVTMDLWGLALKFKSARSTLGEGTFVIVYNSFYLLVLANSGMNPMIYAARMRAFKNALKKLLCSCFKDDATKAYDSGVKYETGDTQSIQEQKIRLTSQD
ncbi:unnamed protein product [Owenia fusiformis]|uniref:G-protein coupled receptors family 1 profile domain-containing protein n=1 Tax=Owenia fusiformis TaxID=6347 RepID=A0A8S4NV89_OWEFU|nr:unnamed protein product [Owenia fusiformis]